MDHDDGWFAIASVRFGIFGVEIVDTAVGRLDCGVRHRSKLCGLLMSLDEAARSVTIFKSSETPFVRSLFHVKVSVNDLSEEMLPLLHLSPLISVSCLKSTLRRRAIYKSQPWKGRRELE